MDFYDCLTQLQKTDITVYDRLSPTNLQKAREIFRVQSQLTDRIRMPEFQYDNLKLDEIANNIEILRQIRGDLNELEPVERAIVMYLVDDLWAKNQFVLSVGNCRPILTWQDAKTMHLYYSGARYWNYKLYGTPDEPMFRSLLQEQIGSLPVQRFSHEDIAMYAELLTRLNIGIASRVSPRYKPRAETVQQFGDLIDCFLQPYFDCLIEGKTEYTPVDVCELLNRIFTTKLETSFRAELAPGKTALFVDQLERKIYVPLARTPLNYTLQEVKKLVIGHELGAHILRSIPFENCKLPYLGTGMPKSEDFEEGVSTCIEQAILGRYTTTGMSRLISHYVNIGLATFLEFDFRKVLETRFMLDFLADVRVDELREEREQRRKWTYDRAFSDATRCFRGSGFLVNCKDLTYFNGNNYVWQFIELGLRNPQQLMVDLFESGKTDPLNPMHKTFLQFAANM